MQRHSSPPALAGAVLEAVRHRKQPHYTQIFPEMKNSDTTPPYSFRREQKRGMLVRCVCWQYRLWEWGGNLLKNERVHFRCSAFTRSDSVNSWQGTQKNASSVYMVVPLYGVNSKPKRLFLGGIPAFGWSPPPLPETEFFFFLGITCIFLRLTTVFPGFIHSININERLKRYCFWYPKAA